MAPRDATGENETYTGISGVGVERHTVPAALGTVEASRDRRMVEIVSPTQRSATLLRRYPRADVEGHVNSRTCRDDGQSSGLGHVGRGRA